MFKKEVRVFFTALMFFTRIPCPRWTDHSPEYLSKSSRYFGLVGIIVGAIGALVFYGSSFIFPLPLALLLSMISTVMATGAFHEDGLADACDGFGGGWTKESILRIMKDSRTGTYGAVGLFFVLAVKFTCLYYVDMKLIPLVLIAGHALSRFAAATLLYTLDYVRDGDDSKAKPAAGRMSVFSLIVGAFWGIIPLALFFNYYYFTLLIPVFLARWYLVRYFKKWIGGQTGDCAGATQQVCEVIFYLAFLIVWRYTL
jgi:adenosylcobinamide-GDP ribazoletransferase